MIAYPSELHTVIWNSDAEMIFFGFQVVLPVEIVAAFSFIFGDLIEYQGGIGVFEDFESKLIQIGDVPLLGVECKEDKLDSTECDKFKFRSFSSQICCLTRF
ncbi:MAG: hypothetical protein EZS28_014746 [Streblomastix strix]|uniref:Uncharacterized protein n=1 Tax=Streblomastix strix TaxID=222440 RepID=A0A5J4W5L5_9EUKA|nr:MAG: hypothetical protein EZS28_014746 [Streblomastix strix]